MNGQNPLQTSIDMAADLREALYDNIAGLIWNADSVCRYLMEGDDTGLIYAYRRMREHDLAAVRTFADLMALKQSEGDR